jgi:predicted DNA-binding transcriptional regulator AlpA
MAAKRDDGERVLTTAEAAAFTRIKPDTLRRWRSQGKGPVPVKRGRIVLYLESDLIAWLRAGRVTVA